MAKRGTIEESRYKITKTTPGCNDKFTSRIDLHIHISPTGRLKHQPGKSCYLKNILIFARQQIELP